MLDFLTSRVPVISDLLDRPVTVLDLARLFSSQPIPPDAVQFIYVLDNVLDLAEKVDSLDNGSAVVRLGSFDLTKNLDLTKPGAWEQLDVSDFSNELGNFDGKAALPSSQRDFFNALQNINGTGSDGNITEGSGGFSIPILEEPAAAFKLLLGQNVSLLDWEAPELRLGFELQQKIPLFSIGIASAFLDIWGGLGVNADFSIGVSTRGLKAFREAEGLGSGVFDFFRKGLYIGDRANAGLGEDRPELVVEGTIGLGVSLSAGPVYVSGGGDLTARAEFDLRDGEGEDRDGLVHLDEFARFFSIDPLCIFESISGGVTVGARFAAGVELLLTRKQLWSYKTPRFELVSFDVELDCDPFAGAPSETQIVDIGRGPGQNVRSTIGGDGVLRQHQFHVAYDNDPDKSGGSVNLQLHVGGDIGAVQISAMNAAGEEVGTMSNERTITGDFKVGETYFLNIRNESGDTREFNVAVNRTKGRTFYVNDNAADNTINASGDTPRNIYMPVPGNDETAVGNSHLRPFATINGVLARNSMKAGDVILLDYDDGSGYSEGRIVFGEEDGEVQIVLADRETVIGTSGLFFDGTTGASLANLDFRQTDTSAGHAAVAFGARAVGNELVNLDFGYITDDDNPFDGRYTGSGWERGVTFGKDAVNNTLLDGHIRGKAGESYAISYSGSISANNFVSGTDFDRFGYGVTSFGGTPVPPDDGVVTPPIPLTVEDVDIRGNGTGSAVFLPGAATATIRGVDFDGFVTGIETIGGKGVSITDSTIDLVGSFSRAAFIRQSTGGLFQQLEISGAVEGWTMQGGENNVVSQVDLVGRFGGIVPLRDHVLQLIDSVGARIDRLSGTIADPNGAGIILVGTDRTEIVDSGIEVNGSETGIRLGGGVTNARFDNIDLIGVKDGIVARDFGPASDAPDGVDFRNGTIQTTTGDGIFLGGNGSHRIEDVSITGTNRPDDSVGLRVGGDFSIVRDVAVDDYDTGLLIDGGGFVRAVLVGVNSRVNTGLVATGDVEVTDVTIEAIETGADIAGGGKIYNITVNSDDQGLRIDQAATVYDNTITATNNGVTVSGQATVRNNIVNAGDVGLLINDEATVHGNTINAGRIGMLIDGETTIYDNVIDINNDQATRSFGLLINGDALVYDNFVDIVAATAWQNPIGVQINAQATLHGNTVDVLGGLAGIGVEINDEAVVYDNVVAARTGATVGVSSNVYDNTFTAITLGVGVGGDSIVRNNLVTATGLGIEVGAGSAAIVRDNTVRNDSPRSGTGVLLAGGGLVRDNLIDGWNIGLDTAVSGIDVLSNEIRNNDIGATGDGTIGSADAQATSERNQIHSNDIGIRLDAEDGLAVVRNNDVYDNRVGIERLNDTADILINDVFQNDLGLRIHGDFGNTNWQEVPNVVRNNVDGIELLGGLDGRGQTLRYTVIRDNTGRAVVATSGSDIKLHNNKILRNIVGIELGGSDNVVRNNTVVGQDDALSIVGASGPITVHNNVLQTETGAALAVDRVSRGYLDSNYNLLWHEGNGLAVRHTKDFVDLYDWQVESGFDRRSLGYTVFDPNRDRPTYANLAGNDVRLGTGPWLDAGNPATPIGREPGDGGGRINLGAHGGDSSTSASPDAWIRLLSPDFHEDRLAAEARFVEWESHDLSGDVIIELLDGSGSLIANVATVPVGDEQYLWTPQDQGIAASETDRYQLRLRHASDPVSYTTRETFSIVMPGTGFYVNDDATAADTFTTTTGDNRATGLTPNSPKASVRPFLEQYSLAAGDTVFVDAGTHTLVGDLFVTNELGVGDDEGFVLRGAGVNLTTLDRDNPFFDYAAVDLADADNVTIEQLTLAGGVNALRVAAASGGNTLRDAAVVGTFGDGVLVADETDGFNASNLDVSNTGGRGITLGADDAVLVDVRISNADDGGVLVRGSSADLDLLDVRNTAGIGVEFDLSRSNQLTGGSLTNSVIEGNLGGVRAVTRDVFQPELLEIGRIGGGNRVANNTSFGIDAAGIVNVEGNAVVDNGGTGITFERFFSGGFFDLGGTGVRDNFVAGHDLGISARSSTNGFSDVTRNRIDPADGGTGIVFGGGVSVGGNEIRGGALGIRTIANSNPNRFVRDNLVVGQSDVGITLDRFFRADGVRSNTVVVDGSADALRLTGDGEDITLRDNILQVADGLAVVVDQGSRDGFDSDFNLFHVTGNGGVGRWQGSAYATLPAWQAATSRDFTSLATDPQFVDPAGGDFHLRSVAGSLHGGSLAPVLGNDGFAQAAPGVLTNDAITSPGVDRGDNATFVVGDEPASDGGFANLGAFGTTSQASRSPADYVLVVLPIGDRTYPAGQSLPIRWRTESDFTGTVTVDLVQNGSVVQTIATNLTNTGSLDWTVPTTVTPGDYGVRITRDDAVEATSDTFTVGGEISAYYVDATGDNVNDGLSAATPMADVKALLDRYDLGAGDTVFVAAGTFNLSQNLTIDADDAGVTIVGAGDATVLNRGDKSNGAWVLEIRADDVTVRDLNLRGGDYGIYLPNGVATTGFVADGLTLGNNDFGVFIDDDHSNATLQGLVVSGGTELLDLDGTGHVVSGGVYSNAGYGGTLEGSGHVVRDATFANFSGFNGSTPLDVRSTDTQIRRNVFRDSNLGPQFRGQGITVTGNTFHGHNDYGAYSNSRVVFDGTTGDGPNVSYDNAYGFEIQSSGTSSFGTLRGNIAYENTLAGVYTTGTGPGLIVDNLVRDNLGHGMLLVGGATADGNEVRDNARVGIVLQQEGGTATNNLVLRNAEGGIAMGRTDAANNVVNRATVRNNTVVDNALFGIRFGPVQTGSLARMSDVRNNIIVQDNGTAIVVEAGSSAGFVQSDYNLVDAATGVPYAEWAGTTYDDRADLVFALGQGRHSIEADPQFVDAANGNYRLMPTSSAIDAGNPADAFGLEPAPAGTRIDLGHTGNTPDATPSEAVKLDVYEPAGLERIPGGDDVTVRWLTVGVDEVAGAAAGNRQATLDATPSLYLGFDEASGTTFADLVGTATGTATGTVTPGQPGPFADSTAAAFAADAYVTVPNSSAPNGQRSLGFATWVRVDDMSDRNVVFLKGFDSQSRLRNYSLTVRENGGVNFITGDGSGFASATSAADTVRLGEWHHIAGGFDRDAGLLRIWVDGQLVIDGTVNSNNTYTGGNPLSVGGNSGTSYRGLVGSVDEFALFADLPTEAEVEAMFAATRGTVDVVAVSGNGTTTPVATDVPDVGFWTGALPGLAAGTYTLRVRHDQTSAAVGESRAFTIVADVSSYFVSPTGNDANDGTNAGQSMQSLDALLALYDLGPGDVVNLAAGTYDLPDTVTVAAGDAGVTIAGDPNGGTILSRGSQTFDTSAFIIDADNVTVRDLEVTTGYNGIHVRNADGVTLDNVTLTGNVDGLLLDNATNATVANSTLGTSNNSALRIDGTFDGLVVRDNAFTGGRWGIFDDFNSTATSFRIENNTFDGFTGYALELAGDRDLPRSDYRIAGNTFRNSARSIEGTYLLVEDNDFVDVTRAFDGSRSTLVDNRATRTDTTTGTAFDGFDVIFRGNTVTNFAVGIKALAGSLVEDNTLVDNTTGILLQSNSGLVTARDNLTTGNDVGIRTTFGGIIEFNTSRGDVVGIRGEGDDNIFTTVRNNLVTDATQNALQLDGEVATYTTLTRYARIGVTNNTLVHDGTNGAAIGVTDAFSDFDFTGNILAVDGGVAWDVAAESAWNFASDYNLYHLTGDAGYADWAGTRIDDASEWFYRLGLDAHGVEGDPQFFNPTGGDYRLLPISPAIDAGPLLVDASNEPTPSRLDLGHTGNTADAPAVADRSLQVDISRFARVDSEHAVPVVFTADSSGLASDFADVRYRDALLAQQPSAYYRLGTDAADATGSFDGTAQGTIDFGVASSFDNADADGAASFAGSTSQRIRLPHTLLDGAEDFAFSTWIKGPDNDPSLLRGMLFTTGDDSGNFFQKSLSAQVFNDDIYVHVNNASSVRFADLGIRDGQWHHVAFSRDGASGEISLWLDGVRRSPFSNSASASGPITVSPGGFVLGQNQGSLGGGFNASNALRGQVDEVAFFRRQLTADEVERQAAHDRPLVSVELVATNGVVTPLADAFLGFDDNGGSLDLRVPTGTTPGMYQLRLSLDGEVGKSVPFEVVRDGREFYIDDARGDDARDGKSAGASMKSLVGVLAAYDLGAGDTVRLASGTHTPLRNVLVAAQDAGVTIVGGAFDSTQRDRGTDVDQATPIAALTLGGGNDAGEAFAFAGEATAVSGIEVEDAEPVRAEPEPGRNDDGGTTGGNFAPTILDRNQRDVATAWTIEFDGADDVTLRNLHVTGGHLGVAMSRNNDASRNWTIEGGRFYANTLAGLLVDQDSNGGTLRNTQFDGGRFVTGLDDNTEYAAILRASGFTVDGISVDGHIEGGVLVDRDRTGDPIPTDFVLRNSTFTDNRGHGLEVFGNAFDIRNNVIERSVENGIDIVGSSGITFASEQTVAGNVLRDNGGIGVRYQNVAQVFDNVATGNDVGFSGFASTNRLYDVAGNRAGLNRVGFDHTGGDLNAWLRYNTAYANDEAGFEIDSTDRLRVDGNTAYSNTTGFDVSRFRGNFTNNLAYGNADVAARFGELNADLQRDVNIFNNTLWQPTGTALQIGEVELPFWQNGETLQIRNNILKVDNGQAITFDLFTPGGSGSTDQILTDFNLYDLGPNGSVGEWFGTDATTLADFVTLTGNGGNSVEAAADFVDVDGADDVLGYSFVESADGGRDDNFQLAAGSAAIDRGDATFAPNTDARGIERRDDTGVVDGPGGVADIGAFEFIGTTGDTTAPTVTASNPAAILAGGDVTLPDFATFTLTFSETLNTADAGAAANYVLVRLADDIVIPLAASYDAATTQVTLSTADGAALRLGDYRLTLNPSGSLRDPAGNALAGGAFVRTFTVVPASAAVTSVALADVAGTSSQQRSLVKAAVVTFDQPRSPAAGDFVLRRVRDGMDRVLDQLATGLVWTDLDGDGVRWLIDFGNARVGTNDAEHGSLPDGVYELVVRGNRGTAQTLRFHRLAGDLDGNGSVTEAERTGLLAALGSRTGDPLFDTGYDINGDGVLDTPDLIDLLSRLNRSLTL